ncbi:hypothetical protein EV2_037085 [Malus domestica]|uniref:Uncharacterized protein n=1 Tax=Malus domestica TaxID=3750 RepID=A0A498JRN4_MALDO|nr:hypothetical protein DVH24_010924 [Malus domestica]
MNQRMVLRRPRTSEGDGVPARWVSADLTRSAMESPPYGFLSSALPASSLVFLLSTGWRSCNRSWYSTRTWIKRPFQLSVVFESHLSTT